MEKTLCLQQLTNFSLLSGLISTRTRANTSSVPWWNVPRPRAPSWRTRPTRLRRRSNQRITPVASLPPRCVTNFARSMHIRTIPNTNLTEGATHSHQPRTTHCIIIRTQAEHIRHHAMERTANSGRPLPIVHNELHSLHRCCFSPHPVLATMRLLQP